MVFFCKSLWNKDNRWFSGCLCTDRFYPHFTAYAKIASEISTGDMVRKLDCRLCCFRQFFLFSGNASTLIIHLMALAVGAAFGALALKGKIM